MSQSTGPTSADASFAEVKQAAQELLARASGPEIAESDLFPHGINRIAVAVKAGQIEMSIEISGPDHSHEDVDDDWLEEDFNGHVGAEE